MQELLALHWHEVGSLRGEEAAERLCEPVSSKPVSERLDRSAEGTRVEGLVDVHDPACRPGGGSERRDEAAVAVAHHDRRCEVEGSDQLEQGSHLREQVYAVPDG